MLVKCWLVLVMIAMAGNAQAFRLLGSAGGLTVQSVEIPGPSPSLFANPPYVCSNNRYVSTDVPVPGCVASPAIGFGQAFSLWQQAPVDAGACHHTVTTCP